MKLYRAKAASADQQDEERASGHAGRAQIARLQWTTPPGGVRQPHIDGLAAREGIKRGPERFCGGIAAGRILSEATHYDMVKRRGQLRIVVRRRRRLRGDNLCAHSPDRSTVKGTHAGGHLIENDAEREQVGPAILFVSKNLLWGKIRRGAENGTRARNLGGEPRDAKIAQLHLAIFGDEDIRRLDVSVNDLAVVRQG